MSARIAELSLDDLRARFKEVCNELSSARVEDFSRLSKRARDLSAVITAREAASAIIDGAS